MILQRAIERESVSQILRTLITRMDGHPDRTRAPTVRLSGTNVTEFGGGSEPGEADATWEAFNALAEAGIVSIKMPRPKSGYAPYELEPVVQLVPEAAERARELLGMMKPGESRAKLWAEAARSVFPDETALHEAIAARWIDIPGKNTLEIMAQLKKLRDLPRGTFLRQCSARLFWGDSKILDGREALICAILGTDESPFPDAPVQIQVFATSDCFDRVIFIENVETFEFLKSISASRSRGQDMPFPLEGVTLAQAYGFRGAAKRMRRDGGSSGYFDAGVGAQSRFRAWLYDRAPGVTPFFYGDLDFSGMSILRALRDTFPDMTSWQPGYAAMLREIQSGNGHPHATSKKKNQEDPGSTGCDYADTVLLPAMRSTGLFFDQEGVFSVVRENKTE